MNLEGGSWRRDALESDVLDTEELLQRRNRRRIIIAVVVAAVLAVIAYFVLTSGARSPMRPAPTRGRLCRQ